MFEYDQDIVNILLEGNDEFRELYREHDELKEKVRDAELGVHPVDDAVLNTMKRRKLITKDRMAVMIESYRREHA
ncbi:MAG: YdcH family protein [Ectothiorhodospiraceae bacterium]|nr:YdcH family protein [Chromatiales bacterium]MCP5153497.1 YdcH family protein [Ectothiorhodospiraceae bacterium]